MRRLLALAIIAAASHPSASPKSAPSWSAASGARLAAWVARAANCSFDARRVALLVAVHPPKFEEAFALLKSSIAAAAGGEADVFFVFSSDADARGFEAALARKGPPLGRPAAWRRSLVVRRSPANDYAWATSKDAIVAKKHAALQALLDDVVGPEARRGGALWPYRYAVVVDAETAWARPAAGFAAAVADRARAPVFRGSDADDAHVLGTWAFFAGGLDADRRADALDRLRGGPGVAPPPPPPPANASWRERRDAARASPGAPKARWGRLSADEKRLGRPLNFWWADVPWYDLETLPRYLAFLRRAAARSTAGKVFEYDLYVSWLVAVERRGVARSAGDLGRRLGKGSWIERRDAGGAVARAGALWAPWYHLTVEANCALPPAVFLLFHRDRLAKTHRFRCCAPAWKRDAAAPRYACALPPPPH